MLPRVVFGAVRPGLPCFGRVHKMVDEDAKHAPELKSLA